MSRLFAGSRTAAGYVDAIGDAARFEWPSIMAFDDSYLYVTEWGDPLRTTTKGCRVRRIDPFTREVTTAAIFNPAAYENPWGITRHPGSGNWYVCCPGLGDVGKSAGRIFVFDPDWNLLRNLRIQDGATNYAIWYACPSPDESVIYAAGHRIQTNPTFGSARFLILDGPTGNVLTTINADTVAGVGSIHSVGGVCIIESTVYWNIAKGGVEGIYTTGLAPTTPADFTLLVSTFSLLPEEAALVTSLRQLHVRGSDGNIIEFASGDTFFNSPFAGTGSHWYDLAADTFTDAADAFPDSHAGAVPGTQLCHEQDYLTAFTLSFVTRCLLRSHAGFFMFEADGPTGVAHSIEIYGDFIPPPTFSKPIHIPHKNWDSSAEAENYHAIERWSIDIVTKPDTLLHIPHKDWSGSAFERDNYRAIERWAWDRTAPLHIPHKEWATPFEHENYLTIERWARRYF